MAQGENSTENSSAALWTCPQCGGTQYGGMMHICSSSQRGGGAAVGAGPQRCIKCGKQPAFESFWGHCLTCHIDNITALKTGKSDDEITRPGGLRDQFAMAVLPFLIESELEDWMKDDDADDWGKHYAPVADDAYKWANAMLEARKK